MDQALLKGLAPVLRLPRRRRYLVLPARDRRALATGLTLLTSCGRRPLLMQTAARLTVRVAGCWVLPGRRESWTPEFSTASWRTMLQDWSQELGPYDNMAVYERPQSFRAGIAVVPMRRGLPLAIIKVRPDLGGLDREIDVLSALDGTVAGLRVPRIMRVGRDPSSGWQWLAMDFITSGVHRPEPLRHPERLDDDLSGKLCAVLPRSAHIPAHWRPMHGDLSPWNLRRDRAGTFLIDWEDATWAPPRADRVYFATTRRAAMGGPKPAWTSSDYEACEYWRGVIGARSQGADDSSLKSKLLTILG